MDTRKSSRLPWSPLAAEMGGQLGRRIGAEIELLAPRGRTRKDLADAIAESRGGRVRRFFHPQGEISKAERTPFFENLTLGFAVEDEAGNLLAQCVDDFTLQDDLERERPSRPGWYRVVSDDARLLRLMRKHCDASEPLERVMDPMAALFGAETEISEAGMIRIADETGAPIVLGASLPGERERPCELITRPIDRDHEEEWSELLELARELEFQVPAEGATHLHFDGESLQSAKTVANLVRFLDRHREALRERFQTNPRCRRLGSWSPELIQLANHPDFPSLDWDEAAGCLKQAKLSKFCDFNLRNLVFGNSAQKTFEVRILPVSLEVEELFAAAEYFSRVLDWASREGTERVRVPDDPDSLG